ncbi:TPM domain-containing protein [Rothia sp. 88186D007BW]
MKNSFLTKTLTLALLAGAGLTGCSSEQANQGSIPSASETYSLATSDVVHDAGDLLSQEQEEALANQIRQKIDEHGSPLVQVYLYDQKMDQFKVEVQRLIDGSDNAEFRQKGAIIAVDKQGKAVFIARGSELRGTLTDNEAAKIVETSLIPQLAKQDYAGGLASAVDEIYVKSAQ